MKFLRKVLDLIVSFNSYYYEGLRGAPIPPDSPIYVERDVDSQVYSFLKSDACLAADCYIFGTPQSGKSSLALRLVSILESEGEICILLSIKDVLYSSGKNFFYSSLINNILQKIRLENEQLSSSLESNSSIPVSESVLNNSKELLLLISQNLSEKSNIKIFIDDIQELGSDSFQDFLNLITRLNKDSSKKIFFVMFGGLSPENPVFSIPRLKEAIAKYSIKPFAEKNRSLNKGMTSIVEEPFTLIRELLVWTGGQPLLTLALLSLSRQVFSRIKVDNFQKSVEKLVLDKVIGSWSKFPLFVFHEESIKNHFIRGSPGGKTINFYALEHYKRILASSEPYPCFNQSLTQRILIESGLVVKAGNCLHVSNPIYSRVFNRQWIALLQQDISLGGNIMQPNYSICDRDFFFLIDLSGSMSDPLVSGKPKQRFDAIQESVLGHVKEILNYRDKNTSRMICNEVTLAFFNVPRPSKKVYGILDASQVEEKFKNSTPAGDTNIAPTFSSLLQPWLRDRQGRGAGVVIYVDGLVDDRADFIKEIRKITKELDHHTDLKILIVGVGEAINSPVTAKWYFELDLNGPDFRDSMGNPCNVVIFNRLDDVNEVGGVIKAIEAQLIEYPQTGLPEWLQEEFPDLYTELKEKYQIP